MPPRKNTELEHRTYRGYTDEEVDEWIALKKTKSGAGVELSWSQVSKRTGLDVALMTQIVSQRSSGKRANACELHAKRTEKIEMLLRKGRQVPDIADTLEVSTKCVYDHLYRLGFFKEERDRLARHGAYWQETLMLTKERRLR